MAATPYFGSCASSPAKYRNEALFAKPHPKDKEKAATDDKLLTRSTSLSSSLAAALIFCAILLFGLGMQLVVLSRASAVSDDHSRFYSDLDPYFLSDLERQLDEGQQLPQEEVVKPNQMSTRKWFQSDRGGFPGRIVIPESVQPPEIHEAELFFIKKARALSKEEDLQIKIFIQAAFDKFNLAVRGNPDAFDEARKELFGDVMASEDATGALLWILAHYDLNRMPRDWKSWTERMIASSPPLSTIVQVFRDAMTDPKAVESIIQTYTVFSMNHWALAVGHSFTGEERAELAQTVRTPPPPKDSSRLTSLHDIREEDQIRHAEAFFMQHARKLQPGEDLQLKAYIEEAVRKYHFLVTQDPLNFKDAVREFQDTIMASQDATGALLWILAHWDINKLPGDWRHWIALNIARGPPLDTILEVLLKEAPTTEGLIATFELYMGNRWHMSVGHSMTDAERSQLLAELQSAWDQKQRDAAGQLQEPGKAVGVRAPTAVVDLEKQRRDDYAVEAVHQAELYVMTHATELSMEEDLHLKKYLQAAVDKYANQMMKNPNGFEAACRKFFTTILAQEEAVGAVVWMLAHWDVNMMPATWKQWTETTIAKGPPLNTIIQAFMDGIKEPLPLEGIIKTFEIFQQNNWRLWTAHSLSEEERKEVDATIRENIISPEDRAAQQAHEKRMHEVHEELLIFITNSKKLSAQDSRMLKQWFMNKFQDYHSAIAVSDTEFGDGSVAEEARKELFIEIMAMPDAPGTLLWVLAHWDLNQMPDDWKEWVLVNLAGRPPLQSIVQALHDDMVDAEDVRGMIETVELFVSNNWSLEVGLDVNPEAAELR